ncbi:WD40-repeat-containing domain protein [Crassisporium funariophilum]|nr:WD40-repeat-containing domain protein [Crassisporium funariophilum]
MRPKHKSHTLPAFPVYSCAFLTPNQLVLGGGGGASKSGIKNKLRLYDLSDDCSIELKDEYELEKGEDAPMSMAAYPESGGLVCGINSVLEKMEKGDNENCRSFSVENSKIRLLAAKNTLPSGDMDDYQKVTTLSPDGTLVAIAGAHDLSLLSYPSMVPITKTIHAEREIYDASFSSTSLVVTTTHNLLVYALPVGKSPSKTSSSNKKGKKKLQASGNDSTEELPILEQQRTVDLPSSTGEGSTFRSARYHPQDQKILYTVVNTVPPRTRKTKSASRQAFICKWNTDTWTVEKTKKVGDRGLTCFDVSPDGRFLGYGSSDLTIGMLDAQTFSPLVTILKAHEFPPTTLKFNSTTTLLVSGSADNSIRIVAVPSVVGGSTWGFIMLFLLALLCVLLAVAYQQYQSGNLKW